MFASSEKCFYPSVCYVLIGKCSKENPKRNGPGCQCFWIKTIKLREVLIPVLESFQIDYGSEVAAKKHWKWVDIILEYPWCWEGRGLYSCVHRGLCMGMVVCVYAYVKNRSQHWYLTQLLSTLNFKPMSRLLLIQRLGKAGWPIAVDTLLSSCPTCPPHKLGL